MHLIADLSQKEEMELPLLDLSHFQCFFCIVIIVLTAFPSLSLNSIPSKPAQKIHRLTHIELCVSLPLLLQAVMDVYVMVLESDGAHVGAAMTAASAALADAACELCDLVPACHVVSEWDFFMII